MKKTVAAILVLSALAIGYPTASFAGTAKSISHYTIDKVHSDVSFGVRHLGLIPTRGSFTEFSGGIVWDDTDLSRAYITGNIEMGSINTQNQMRDNHLKAPDFFDAATYPMMSFVSKKITKNAKGEIIVVGNLTIKKTTKEVSAPLVVTDIVVDPMGKTRRGFSATLRINRDDYGVSYNSILQNGSFAISKEVDITLGIEGIKD